LGLPSWDALSGVGARAPALPFPRREPTGERQGGNGIFVSPPHTPFLDTASKSAVARPCAPVRLRKRAFLSKSPALPHRGLGFVSAPFPYRFPPCLKSLCGTLHGERLETTQKSRSRPAYSRRIARKNGGRVRAPSSKGRCGTPSACCLGLPLWDERPVSLRSKAGVRVGVLELVSARLRVLLK